jgi:single-strand DNA-binding protein
MSLVATMGRSDAGAGSRHERRLRHPNHSIAERSTAMSDTLTVTGVVATTPRHVLTTEKLPITSFRLASTQRRYDRGEQKWVDGDTNWYTITTFRQLALNLVGSVEKGQRVVVTGRLQLRDWDNGEKKGLNVEIVAEAVGHDLSWGTASFTRSMTSSSTAADADPAAGDADGVSGEEPASGADGVAEVLEFPGVQPVAVPF